MATDLSAEDIREMIREEATRIIREELSIDIKNSSNYTGGLDGGSLYQDSRTLKLMLGSEVISEVYLD